MYTKTQMVNAFKYYCLIPLDSKQIFTISLEGIQQAITDCNLLDDRGCTLENTEITYKQIMVALSATAEGENMAKLGGLPRCKFIECFFRVAALRYQTFEKRKYPDTYMFYYNSSSLTHFQHLSVRRCIQSALVYIPLHFMSSSFPVLLHRLLLKFMPD